jgi:flagellar hook-associated protein FlgK
MTDLVSVASNAVASYQRALGTISNNIANVATDGYSRQEVVLQANPVAKVGNTYMGTGVTVDRLQRQYDTFVESNLRSSNSDLLSQEPMVTYANRVIDIMGGPSMGLSSALDQFFGSARNLSADPASSVLRGSFVRDAENLATRFSQLSSQLDLVQSETDQLVEGHVSEMNTTIQQLAEINVQLTKQKNAANQPPDLLDQRDKLLKEFSSFARINTYFQENGAVTVSLGPSITRDVVVDGVKSLRIGTSFNAASPEKVALVIDPYGDASPLTSLTSGKLSGLMSFREQVLGSSRSALNVLANSVVKEVNALHEGGIDAYGNKGVALFTIDATNTAAAGTMEVAFADPLRVAAAAQFRVIESPLNTGEVDANITYETPVFTGPKALDQVLVNNPLTSKPLNVQVSISNPVAAVTTITNGFSDVQILLGEADVGQQLQVFTRDGRQIMGAAMNTTLQGQVMTAANGFVPNATYNASYLNLNGSTGYKDISVFYGAKAEIQKITNWDMTNLDPQKHVLKASTNSAAILEGGRMLASPTSIASNTFTLNGVSLGAKTAANSTQGMQASDLRNWIQAAIDTSKLAGATDKRLATFSVSAQNDIKIPAKQINLKLPVTLKGGSATATAFNIAPTDAQVGFASVKDLADAINAAKETTKVVASLDPNGDLVLGNLPGTEGDDIVVSGVVPNSLGIAADTYKGRISISRALDVGVDTPVELGFGIDPVTKNTIGTPADLAMMGFKTGAYIKGSASEDLLVFVTGTGEAKVSAAYQGAAVNPKESLRTQPLEVKFSIVTESNVQKYYYTITDTKTQTEVAKREFDPTKPELFITYQGLKIGFSSPPQNGDTFTVDGNKDGTGNNENMLAIANLETKGVMGGGKTMGAYYIDHVNDMGNIARQAAISQSALQVVYDQAVTARDEVSGVSLDEEAANLIRFQQAYQAAAKILQVASQLFDSVLQVR